MQKVKLAGILIMLLVISTVLVSCQNTKGEPVLDTPTSEQQAIIDANSEILEEGLAVLKEKGYGLDTAEKLMKAQIGTIVSLEVSEVQNGFNVTVTDDYGDTYVLGFDNRGLLDYIQDAKGQFIFSDTGEQSIWYPNENRQ